MPRKTGVGHTSEIADAESSSEPILGSALTIQAFHSLWLAGFILQRMDLEEVCRELGIKLKLINVDLHSEPSIPGLPDFRLLRDGELIGEHQGTFPVSDPYDGEVTRQAVRSWLARHWSDEVHRQT